MSCIFCESNFHASQNCDVYVSDESRRQILLTKKRCGRCLTEWNENSDSACCQNCQFNEKCYICFSKWHHTVYCPDKFYVPSIPKLDKVLVPRFINTLNLEEKYFLAFLSPIEFNLIKPGMLTIVENNEDIKQPLRTNLIVTRNALFTRKTLSTNDGTYLLPPWETINFKCENVTADRVKFSTRNHFSQLFTPKLLQISFSHVKFGFEVNFIEILKAAPNLEIIDFVNTAIKTDSNKWPEDLIKWNKGKGLSKLRIPIADINFDMDAFIALINTKSKSNVKITLDIETSTGNYTEICTKMCNKYFGPVKDANVGPIIVIYFGQNILPFSFNQNIKHE